MCKQLKEEGTLDNQRKVASVFVDSKKNSILRYVWVLATCIYRLHTMYKIKRENDKKIRNRVNKEEKKKKKKKKRERELSWSVYAGREIPYIKRKRKSDTPTIRSRVPPPFF